jgi:predicted nucleic acid-binding protein
MEGYARQDLQHLIDTPDLLESLYQTSHPQAQYNLQALTETWSTNRSIAGIPVDEVAKQIERILTREEEIEKARKTAEERLAEAKELEKQWQQKQAEMDQAMKVARLAHIANCSHSRLPHCIPS